MTGAAGPLSAELHAELRGEVLWLTIRREARANTLTPALVQSLEAALQDAERSRPRAVVLTGAGTQAFCAGADLRDGAATAPDPSEPYAGLAGLLRTARQLTVPLVARVNGSCMAGGMGLLAICDLAAAARHARFGLPEVRVGLLPAQVLAVLAPQLGTRALNALCLLGEPIDADAARAIGLVDRVDDDVDAALDALLAPLLRASPQAVRRYLYTVKRLGSLGVEERMAFCESQFVLAAATDDAREGREAFVARRPPRWSAA